MLVYLLLSLISSFSINGAENCTILSSDFSVEDMVIELELDLGDVNLSSRGQFTEVQLENGMYRACDGYADLPILDLWLSTPYGSEFTYSIEGSGAHEYRGVQLETVVSYADNQEPPPTEIFTGEMNLNAWSENMGYTCGLPIRKLFVCPFSYDSATNTLTTYDKINVVIESNGGVDEHYRIWESDVSFYEQKIINFDDLRGGYDLAQDNMGVIFNASSWEYYNIVKPIVKYYSPFFSIHWQWLYDPSLEQVQNIIDYWYDNNDVNYVLLVGDENSIPSHTMSGYSGTFDTDQEYALMDEGLSLDLSIGRLTGTPDDLEWAYNKIINQYEKFFPTMASIPEHSRTWSNPNTVILVADDDNGGDFIDNCESIRTYTGYVPDLNWITHYEPNYTLAELDHHINCGPGIVLYRGHGSWNKWNASPSLYASHIFCYSNVFLPIVFNIACDNGDYQHSGNCVGEGWQFALNGASGNLAATTTTYHDQNIGLAQDLFYYMYHYEMYRVGKAVKWSLNSVPIPGWLVDPIGHIHGRSTRFGYIWFGVPTQHIWTIENSSSHFNIPINFSLDEELNSSTDRIRVNTPVRGSAVIQTGAETSQVDIYDISGRQVFTTHTEESVVTVNTTGWAVGVYYVTSSIDERLETTSFVVIGN